MEYSLTIFQSIYDNSTHRQMRLKSWESFESLLYDLSEKSGYKPKKEERKLGSPLISPAVYKKGVTRKNDNVLGWGGWAALDIDDYDCPFDQALLGFKGVRHLYYSSASSTAEHPKFRVVIPCSRPILSKEIKHFWYALNKEYSELGDPQTKDLSRMYYVPAKYPGSYQFIASHNDAPILDPTELMRKHPWNDPSSSGSLSEALKEQVMRYRLSNCNNTSLSWKSYRDCPFVNKKLVNEYRSISSSGWYSKMYAILCSTAAAAIRRGYPLSPSELETLAREIDNDTGGWYKSRPFFVECKRAIDWALTSC
jgi:hypothetical protein